MNAVVRERPGETKSDAGAYVSEAKIYPREVFGRLQRLRITAVLVLLGLFYLLPWLRWDGHQAVLFDLPARKFHVLGLTFWPQDFVFLALLLIMAALSLFFFTALAGRLWCGYACPQTVWTEVFLMMERWTEGSRLARMRLDAGPWNRTKLLRKGSKHLLWAVFALWTGFTFVGFFTPITDLAARLAPFRWGGWESFWVLFYGLATWGNAGFLREQVCKYMCPYARFQSAMFDRNTLIIAYDPMRGEPRGSRRRGLPSVLERGRGLLDRASAYLWVFRASGHPAAAEEAARAGASTQPESQGEAQSGPLPPAKLGDCVDCTMCVQVCPTGIDIRNGLQYECIACGACIDACDQVMDKLAYPRGLIRYSTQNAIEGRPTRVLRPRIVIYGVLLLALAAGWAWGVTHRSTMTLEVLRDRNALYVVGSDGRLQNTYTLKIVNKRERALDCRVSLDDRGLGLELRGGELAATAPAGEVSALAAVVRGADTLRGRHEIDFRVRCAGEERPVSAPSSFFGPSP